MSEVALNRRSLLKSAAAAAPLLALGERPAAQATAQEAPLQGMNVLLFMTDQQRATMHFPEGWEEENLPGLQRLKQHGVSFSQATCNACMCSPSRATLMTGYHTPQHGVKYVLEVFMPAPQYPQVEMPLDLPNLGTVFGAAGYATPYKGKWHCSKPANVNTNPNNNPPCTPNEGWVPEDVNKYGFQRWNPQDAGANQFICQAGGGIIDNDKRFMTDDGDPDAGKEGALTYLRSAAAKQQPFFLTVSLVNPHDVLSYPAGFTQFGYDDSWLASTGIDLPASVDDDLSTKPAAQAQFNQLSSNMRPKTPDSQRDYLNFYGNLMKQADAYLVQVLDTLEEQGLLENTLVIFTSDHGEMGMAHGGMIQKNFNVYEETLRVPLVYSNPKLFPEGRTSGALVSHVDFLPTMASLIGAPESARADWQGRDYSQLLLDPTAGEVQEYTVFTYDDIQAGQPRGPYVTGANHIQCVRDTRYTYARYYDPTGQVDDEFEMYDRQEDPNQMNNLAWPGTKRTPEQEEAYQRLRDLLAEVQATRLQPLA